MSARQARDNRGAHKARALLSNGAFRDDTTSAHPARASSRLYMSTVYGRIPDLIQCLAVMRSARKAPAVISNGAFHDGMTSARQARSLF